MKRINFTDEELKKCFDFAMKMKGNHNPNMIMKREDSDIFRDDFRGKLGELAVKKYLEENVCNARIDSELDFDVTPRGQWDKTDIIVNNKYINVKSIKQNSKFLLLESLRYDDKGNYVYKNNDDSQVIVDYYILVRVTIEPDVQRNIFKQDFENFLKDGLKIEYNNGSKIKKSVPREIFAEVLGGISHNDFWELKSFAPQGIRCDVKNLNHITSGKDINNLPSAPRANDNINNTLQQDNYVIHEDHLKKLEELFE